jgi:hypothetical protein
MLELASFSDDTAARGRRWISLFAFTFAEETAGHPHKFQANRGEGRAAEYPSTDREGGG